VLEILGQLVQYGPFGAATAAVIAYSYYRDRARERELKEIREAHGKDIAARDAEIARLREDNTVIHKQHKDDLKDASKNAIALHADIYEVAEQLGKWADFAKENVRGRPR
jgi:hypothetical protein